MPYTIYVRNRSTGFHCGYRIGRMQKTFVVQNIWQMSAQLSGFRLAI